MSELLIERPQIGREGDDLIVRSTIRIGPTPHEVWFRVPEGAVSGNADAFLAASLFPAMAHGVPVRVNGPVSKRLAGTAPAIQSIFHSWFPDFRAVPIETRVAAPAPMAGDSGVACFFTGGVDSFYSVLKHRHEITHLLFVHGFDIPLDACSLRERVSRELRAAASDLGKVLLEIETNARLFSDSCTHWGVHQHGAGLASVALLLAPRFRRVYVPATFSYAELIPWASHPLLDPLWSVEGTDIVHDGCEASRYEKAAVITRSPAVLARLRVCQKNPDGAYNCSRCEKCVRTMLDLDLLDVLEQAASFEGGLDPASIARLEIPGPSARVFFADILDRLARRPDRRQLERAVRAAVRRFDRLHSAEPVRRLWGLYYRVRDGWTDGRPVSD